MDVRERGVNAHGQDTVRWVDVAVAGQGLSRQGVGLVIARA